MTEWLILASVGLSGFFLVDPLFSGSLPKTAFAKVVVLVTVYGSIAFHLLGRLLSDRQLVARPLPAIARQWWPTLALGTFIVIGSLYARVVDNVRETFLGTGLGFLFLPLFAWVVLISARPEQFVQRLGWVYVLTMVAMLPLLVSGNHIYHEEVFLIVPLAFYFLSAPRPRAWQLIFAVVLLVASLFSFKNTTFLIILACFAMLTFLKVGRMTKERTQLARLVTYYFFIVTCLLLLALAAYLWWWGRDELPTGNVEYRHEMYGIAWRKFLASPLWGTAYADAAVEHFRLWQVAGNNMLPTHSDVLDLLAHGGVIAFSLWLLMMVKAAAIMLEAMRRLRRTEALQEERAWRCIWVLGLVQITALITYAFNPPLLSPIHGLWIWGSLGVMYALHSRMRRQAAVRELMGRARRQQVPA